MLTGEWRGAVRAIICYQPSNPYNLTVFWYQHITSLHFTYKAPSAIHSFVLSATLASVIDCDRAHPSFVYVSSRCLNHQQCDKKVFFDEVTDNILLDVFFYRMSYSREFDQPASSSTEQWRHQADGDLSFRASKSQRQSDFIGRVWRHTHTVDSNCMARQHTCKCFLYTEDRGRQCTFIDNASISYLTSYYVRRRNV